MPYYKLLSAYNCIKSRIPFKPKVALILGSGLGAFAEGLDVKASIPYSEIEGMAVSTAPTHKGRFVFAYIEGVPAVIMQGRVHYYEGYSMSEVVMPIRLMAIMGASVLFLTNASGGINKSFKAGDFMLINDQIASLVPSPLIGKNIEELGVRFPDMSEIYNKNLCGKIKKAALNEKINLKEGVYIQLTGPAFESPAEVNMCRVLGADAVGMSTACEAVAANHMGMSVCGVSCVSNMASGICDEKLTLEDVELTAERVGRSFGSLIAASIKLIGEE